MRKFPGSDAYFYVTERMAIDADGAPNAYHPQNTAIGGWDRVLACVER